MYDRRGLNKAFKELSKMGYFAKKNYLCCQGCAVASMDEEQAEKYVFYHNQDNFDLTHAGFAYLAWSGNGNEIVDVLIKHGVTTIWNGSDTQRIKITLKKKEH
jgi:hypothetical protein